MLTGLLIGRFRFGAVVQGHPLGVWNVIPKELQNIGR